MNHPLFRLFYSPRKSGGFDSLGDVYRKTKFVVTAYYCLSIAVTFAIVKPLFDSFGQLPNRLIWPVSWIDQGNLNFFLIACIVSLLVGQFACVFRVEWAWGRVLFFLGTFFTVAFSSSFNKVAHPNHISIWMNFLFCFLPLSNGTISAKNLTLAVFRYAQIFTMLFYSLAGFWKLARGVEEIFKGKLSIFNVEGFPTQLAQQIINFGYSGPLTPFVFENPVPFQFSIFGAIYIQLLAITVVFRPNLHRIWGVSLVAMHLGTYLFLGFVFQFMPAIVALFFVLSPFAPDKQPSLIKLFFELPIVYEIRWVGNWLTKKMVNGPRAVVIYDGDCGICRKFMMAIQRLDSRQSLSWRPFQDEKIYSEFPFLRRESCEKEIKLIELGSRNFKKDYGGGDAVMKMFTFLRWTFPLGLVGSLPGFRALVNWIYPKVARNRHLLGSTCKID